MMLRTIGPVWDGNEVWLVVAGGATFAAFPAWYATMFSGFYIALLLLLVFLIVRVLSFEWRASTRARAGVGLDVGEHDRQLRRGARSGASRSRTSSTASPIDSNGDFSGNFWDLFNLYTLLGGRRVRAAVRLPRRDLPDAAHDGRALPARGGGGAAGSSIAAAVVGAAFLIWTVVVAVDRNDKDVFPPLLPALLGDRGARAGGRLRPAAAAAAGRSR